MKICFLLVLLICVSAKSFTGKVEEVFMAKTYEFFNSTTERYLEFFPYTKLSKNKWRIQMDETQNCRISVDKSISYQLSKNKRELHISLPQCETHQINFTVKSSAAIRIDSLQDLLSWEFIKQIGGSETYSIETQPSFLRIRKTESKFKASGIYTSSGFGFNLNCKISEQIERCKLTDDFSYVVSYFQKYPLKYRVNQAVVSPSSFRSLSVHWFSFFYSPFSPLFYLHSPVVLAKVPDMGG